MGSRSPVGRSGFERAGSRVEIKAGARRAMAGWEGFQLLFYTGISMSYAAAIDALNALAPELFIAPGRPRRKFSLAEFGVLLTELGDPQRRFPSILIAGTNGKGSTASTLSSILRASGLR